MRKFLTCLLVLFVLCGCSEEKPVQKIDMSKVASIADLKGVKIAVQSGTLQASLAEQIEKASITSYPEFADMTTAVKSGVVEGAVMDEPVAIVYTLKDPTLGYVALRNNNNGFTCDASKYENAAAVVKGSPLLAEINSVLEKISMETCYQLMEEIIKVSNGEKVSKFCLENEEPKEYKGTLKVGMECASEPFNWTDIEGTSYGAVDIYSSGYEGMKANGLDVQIAKYIANALGYKLEVYAIEWDSLLPSLNSGVIDVIIGNMSPTEERKAAGYDFSKSYYDVNYVVLYKK